MKHTAKCSNSIREEKGSITVFLVIVLAAVAMCVGILIDLGRIKTAQNRFRRAVTGAARSVLADYHTALKTNYGLFAVNGADSTGEFQKYLRANISASRNQTFNLLDFRCGAADITLGQSLSNPQVMKQQILEIMKYRAPVEISRELIAKLREVAGLARFYDDSNENRKSLGRINERIASIHRHNVNIGQARDQLRQDKIEWAANRDKIRTLEGSGAKEDRQRLRDLRRRQDELEQDMETQRSLIRREIAQAKREKTEIEVELVKMEQARDLRIYDSGEAKSAVVQPEEGPVRLEMEKAKERQREALRNINRDISQAEEALAAERAVEKGDDPVLSRIGIASATEAYQRTAQETNKSITGNEYGQAQLEEQVRRLMMQNPGIGRCFNRETVNGNLGSFEKTEGPKADGIADRLRAVYGRISLQGELVNLRDEIFINEYALTYFSFLTSEPKGGFIYPYRNTEAEYICYGGSAPMVSAISELYVTRFALDTMAYFAFSKAPTELLARTAYSLVMGAVHAAYDTFRLVALKETVPVASMLPDNPLEKTNLTLSYKDHLRLFLLMHDGEQAKLNRIALLIKARSGLDPACLYTSSGGTAEISVRMWFLPLAGLRNTDNGPFGTTIRNGRCYIRKSFEQGY